jgi:glycoprotein endo-alpha-1,2-mannosidase
VLARLHLSPFFSALILLLMAGLGCGGAREATAPSGADPAVRPELLVGAHYYLWFPTRFQGGTYLRARLDPAQKPLLGEYSSASAGVVEQHIAWASQAGITFFALDWWPGSPAHNEAIDTTVFAARSVSSLRYCIFYELGALGYDADSGTTSFDQATSDRFLADMSEIASRYFRHPRYLQVAGRPVIILYVTRTATGRFPEAMARFRARLSELGFDPYVIGDEIYWTVARQDGAGETAEPQLGRIALFDAITSYNLYDPMRGMQSGYGASSTLLSDAHSLYDFYRTLAPRTPVIPLAMPGYNDRAFRLDEGHPAIPREWAPGAGEGSFFEMWLELFALPMLDPRLPMLLVTSWNEWSEDTAIEPAAQAPATVSDRSRSGSDFTQGYRYEGYGTRYLQILRDKLAARSADAQAAR